jgi:hypothetical protein
MPHTTVNTLVLVASLAVLPGLSACECSGNKGRTVGNPTASVVPPTPTPPGPAQTPPSPAATPDPNVGETIAPVTNDTVVALETGTTAGLRHIVFEASAKTEQERYLAEYLMVVRSSKATCLRMKIRPTTNIVNSVGEDAIKSGELGVAACTTAKTLGEAPPAPSPGTTPAPASPSALALTSGNPSDSLTTGGFPLPFDFVVPGSRPSWNLVSKDVALCSARIFRSETDASKSAVPIDKFVTKTGRLVVIGSKVRIWLDEEFSNVCTGGGPLDNQLATPFGPLIQSSRVPRDWKDKVWLSQLQALAVDMDKITTGLAGVVGVPSDVDESQFVEIFVTPEINRTRLVSNSRNSIDDFRAKPIFKPQDLAYYNAETNPTSNEGEVLYLWSPDPASMYGDFTYPSANSLTTNFAKGYLTAQLMGLIYLNEKVLKQKLKTIDDPWLVQSLSLLVSGLFAGIDYTSIYLASYLTSRSQYIPLSEGLTKELFSEKYLPIANDEQIGFRTVFGWYLQGKVCGENSVVPCAALRKFVETPKTGKALVQEVLGLTYDEALKNAALSLAIGTIKSRDGIFALWDAGKPGLPPKPIRFPDLLEIFPADPRLTVEENNNGSLSATANELASKIDRTVAGPYPSRDLLYSQPLAPDYDLELKFSPDATSVIWVTGLVAQTTDAAAYLGEGLSIIFVPIGERNVDSRSVHFEKLSENAPSDVRPINLAKTIDPFRTYRQQPFYDATATNQMMVTNSKEIWSFGSIGNFSINTEGTKDVVGGSDALNVELQPCSDVAAPELAACQAKTHKAVIQVYIREAEKELAPMLLVTTTDRVAFRGHTLLGKLSDLQDPEFVESPHTIDVLCQADHTTNTVRPDGTDAAPRNVLAVTFNAGSKVVSTGSVSHGYQNDDIVYFTSSDGLTPPGIDPYYGYTVANVLANSFQLKKEGVLVSFFDPPGSGIQTVHKRNTITRCANGGLQGATVFSDAHSRLTVPGYNHNYDNFLMQGILGFPFFNWGSVEWADRLPCKGPYCYTKYERDRQFLKFKLDGLLESKNYRYSPVTIDYDQTEPIVILEDEKISKLASIKSRVDSASCSDPQSDAFVGDCSAIEGLSEVLCKNICAKDGNHLPLESAIKQSLQGDSFGICRPGRDCTGLMSLMGSGYPPSPASPTQHTGPWLSPSRFVMYDAPVSGTDLTTYYVPVQPQRTYPSLISKEFEDYCFGYPDANGVQFQRCLIKKDSIMEVKDIRAQLNVPAARLSYECFNRILEGNTALGVDVCIDGISVVRETEPETGYLVEWYGRSLPTDKNRIRKISITTRAGEIVAKPERIQAVIVEVPGTGKMVNIIVGGRGKSQGKYLLRARLLDLK